MPAWIKTIFLSVIAAASAHAAAPLRVVTLTTVLTEIATEVGGPDAAVAGVVRPGVDPHTFEPSPADMQVMAGADLVLAGGLGLESYLDRLARSSGTGAKVAEVGSVLADIQIYIEAGGRREPDPHWWNSIKAMALATRQVATEMAGLRPESGGKFRSRAEAYVSHLAALDQWARGEIVSIPPGRRQLVTTHDAFGWFARDYGFTVHPISGISPEAEPDARELAHLVDLIRRDKIPAIFVENSANPGLAETLIRETGVKLGGLLYADGLAPSGEGATYEGMFRHNVRTIVAALK